MVHGENKLTEFDYNRYYQSAQEDIMELIQEYPFTKRVITPSAIPEPIILNVVAVNIGLIGECNAQATVIDLQERLFRRYLLTSKKSPILFTHQLDN